MPDEMFEGARNAQPRAHRPGLIGDDDY